MLEARRHEEGGGTDGWGPLGSDMRERKRCCRTTKLEEEAPFGKYAKAAQAEWAEHVHGGLRAKRAGTGEAGPDDQNLRRIISE
jgi:hypothetical protein